MLNLFDLFNLFNQTNLLPLKYVTMTQNQSRDSICIVLSALFLDVQLSQREIYSMAASLHQLNASADVLDDILYHDLFPILCPNLLGVCGIWTAFDEQWLLGQIYRRRKAHLSYVQRFCDYILWVVLGGLIRQEFDQLKKAAGNGQHVEQLCIEQENELSHLLKQAADSPKPLKDLISRQAVEQVGNMGEMDSTCSPSCHLRVSRKKSI
ncbi:hypothetical protein F4825DRAFT_439538 [Nemania diffusa]|nr:hypothetical protein F4825DRAFT_439538 [Nemania diffusa]